MNAPVYAMVMAGGVGSRFWPMSRRERPKQLLPLAGGERSLLRATVERIAPICGPERVLILTSETAGGGGRRCAAGACPRRTFSPSRSAATPRPASHGGRAGCSASTKDAVCMVLPADHHIADEPAYLEVLRTALAAAEGRARW